VGVHSFATLCPFFELFQLIYTVFQKKVVLWYR